MARPFKLKDEQLKILEQLAAINCSYEEMGAVMGINPSNLTRNYAQLIESGRAKGRMSLKRKQYEMANGGNVALLIWLGKQLLGQSDKREDKIEARVEESPSKELTDLFKEVITTARNVRR